MKLTDKIECFNEDCMTVMARYPDKYFDLAVVDPPYGIKDKIVSGGANGRSLMVVGGLDRWDDVPTHKYFDELRRVSKNQIIWGGNYFPQHLRHSRGWIVWDKKMRIPSFSMGELAYSSFNKNLEIISIDCLSEKKEYHPTQKPIKLYDWIFKNYAEQGMKILDTHGGSMSSVISADKAGLEMVCCELDKEYFDKAVDRFQKYKSQLRLAI